MSLVSDPEGWARQASGSKRRLLLMIMLQFLLYALVAVIVVHSLLFRHAEPTSTPSTLYFVAPPLFLAGVVFPGMYLYAMFRLLKQIDDMRSQIPDQNAKLP